MSCFLTLLDSLKHINGQRVYQCPLTGLVCVISGEGLDEELLELACEGCKRAPPQHTWGGAGSI